MRKVGEGEDAVEEEVPADEVEKIFEEAKTYIHIKFSVETPINPVQKFEIPVPTEIIAKKPPLPKFPPTKDACEDFRRQISLAIESIGKEYFVQFQDELETEEKERGNNWSENVGSES